MLLYVIGYLLFSISGCKTLPEGQRYCGLTSEIRHKNTLYVVSTNSFDGKIKKGKDGYHSTRHGGKGTGLASIAATAEKYQGTAQCMLPDYATWAVRKLENRMRMSVYIKRELDR